MDSTETKGPFLCVSSENGCWWCSRIIYQDILGCNGLKSEFLLEEFKRTPSEGVKQVFCVSINQKRGAGTKFSFSGTKRCSNG